MRVSVLQENLAKGLGIASRAVPGRPTMPVLANIKIATDDGRLKLSATNLELGITARIGAKVDEEGAITVPARTLVDWVNTLPPERVDLELDSATETLSVRCGTTVANIKGMAAEQMPNVPEFDDADTGAEIPAAVFQTMIEQVVFAAAREDNRPVLMGIQTRLDGDKVRLASSDGFRMAMRSATIERPASQSLNLVIPARAMSELGRIISSDAGSVFLSVPQGRNQVMFHLDDVDIVSQLIEGKFPEVDALIPKTSNTSVTMLTADLLAACRRTEIFAREANNTMRLRVKPGETSGAVGQVIIGANAKEKGDNEGSLDAIITGPGLEISFNVRFLIDVLSVLDSEQVVLELNGPTNAGLLKPAGRTDFQYVVSPMSPR